MSFTVLDYVIIAIIILSTILGLWRGFLRETISLVTWVLALFIPIKFAPSLMQYLAPLTSTAKTQYVIALIILFVIVLILGALVARFLSKSAKVIGLGLIDRLFGMVFGAVRGGIFVTIILLLIQSTALSKQTWAQGSIIAPHFSPVITYFDSFIPVKFVQMIDWFKKSVRA